MVRVKSLGKKGISDASSEIFAQGRGRARRDGILDIRENVPWYFCFVLPLKNCRGLALCA